MLNRPFSALLKDALLLGICGALCLFVSEWVLSAFYAEINIRTYLFFGALFLGAGIVTGMGLGVFAKLFSGLLQGKWWRSDSSAFLPAIFLAFYFYLYGFYYLNEKLTAGVGAAAPLSLAADFVYLLFAFAIFRLALSIPGKKENAVLRFLEIGFLPILLLVAVNLRFFAWQPPLTDHFELFRGLFAFGFAGLLGVILSKAFTGVLLKNGGVAARSGSVAAAAFVIIVLFVVGGTPSANSFYRTDDVLTTDEQAPRPKNIIWIVTDTVRRDHVSLYGAPEKTTPNIDKFAEDALVFDRAISTAPWTLPSHASMFTGMFPSKHGAHFVGDAMFSTPLVPENLTLAEILAAHGYKTAGIVANNAGLSRQLGCDQGFQYYFDDRPLVFSLFWGRVLLSLSDNFRIDDLWVNEVCLSSELKPLVKRWLDKNTEDGPFFLFVNLMESHGGIAFVPEPYDSMYGFDRERQQEIFKDFDADKIVFFQDEVTDEERAFWTSYVMRKVTFMDAYLGELFADLKARGLYDDSFIVLNSDHGELFGEHNSFGHNTDLYNELISIPMLVKYPQMANKGRSSKPVQPLDIMPELLSQIGLPIPEEVQGQPFAEVNHPVISELFQQQHNAHARRSPGRYYRDLKAIFGNVDNDSLKYIWASNDQSELFDMANDPGERTNILENQPAAADSLHQRLEQWGTTFQPMKTGDFTKKMDKKELEKRLRSLGYIK